jgi:hypothetical protein
MAFVDKISIGGTVRDIQDTEARRVLQITDRIYQGADLSQKFAVEITAYATVWDWIKDRIQTANYADIHVGDYIPFVAGGNNIKAEIAGIDTYYRYGTADVGHHIDFISRDVWPAEHVWNKANFNNGTTVSPHPFLASDIHAWLNSLQMNVPNAATADPALVAVDYRTTGVLDKLPAALTALIIPKNILLPIRYSAGALLTDDNSWAWVNLGKLWLPSEIEVYGCEHFGSKNGLSSGGFQQYPIFAQNMKRVKGYGDGGGRVSWWLLSVSGGTSAPCAFVGGYGNGDSGAATSAGICAPLCFRIA